MGRWSIACAAFSMIAWWWWRRRRARTSSHRGGGNSQMYICFWYRLILCTLKRGNNSWYVSFGVQSWLLHIQSEHAEETTIIITTIDIFLWHLSENLNKNCQKIANYYHVFWYSREKYSRGPNNSVVLNKRVRGTFCSLFIGENAWFWENLKSYKVKKCMLMGFFCVIKYLGIWT